MVKAKIGFAASIVETVIENNLELINSLIRGMAEHEGIDPQALEQRWLNEENYPSNKD